MKAYFALQYKMTNRKLRAAGVHPLLAYTLGVLVFVVLALYLFQKTSFAKYLFVLGYLSIVFPLTAKDRSDFLHTVFGDQENRRIRVLENGILSLPFVVVLAIKGAFWELSVLLLLGSVLAIFSFHSSTNLSIPTPFAKQPFEFTVGFRKTFFIFPIAYGLTIIAISVDNLNLGIFSMLLLFLTAMNYYLKPEPQYYVWIHSHTPNAFLFYKIRVATKNMLLLCSPILLGLLAFYPSNYGLLLLFFMAGLLLLCTVIMAKYAAYPRELNLPETILLALSIVLPLFVVFTLPFFYSKALKQLNSILHDKH